MACSVPGLGITGYVVGQFSSCLLQLESTCWLCRNLPVVAVQRSFKDSTAEFEENVLNMLNMPPRFLPLTASLYQVTWLENLDQ